MGDLLSILIDILTLRTAVARRRVVWWVRLCIILPFILIVAGAFLGGISMYAKIWLIGIGMTMASGLFVWATARSAAGGVLVTATLAKLAVPGRSIPHATMVGAESFFKVISAIAASEIAIGFMALVLPAHVNPAIAILLLPLSFGAATYTIWRGGATWWPGVVGKTMAIGFIFVILALFVQFLLPQTLGKVTDKHLATKLDEGLAGWVENPSIDGLKAWWNKISFFDVKPALPPLVCDKPTNEQFDHLAATAAVGQIIECTVTILETRGNNYFGPIQVRGLKVLDVVTDTPAPPPNFVAVFHDGFGKEMWGGRPTPSNKGYQYVEANSMWIGTDRQTTVTIRARKVS